MFSSLIRVFVELRSNQALIWALATRHLAMRYRGSVLGFFWSFLNPLCLMLVYALVFKFYIRFNDVNNYTVFLFCGLLPWIWTQSSLIEGANSITSSGHLITKSMFPAHILPAVAVLTGLFHYVLSLPLLLAFMWFYGTAFSTTLFLVPIVIIFQTLMLYGLAMFLASLNVQFRDVQYVTTNILSFLFFLCPILYPRTVVPERFQFTMDVNPFSILIDLYHKLILDGVFPELLSFVLLVMWALIFLLMGVIAYEGHRDTFAELL